jgi:hypothetical protein
VLCNKICVMKKGRILAFDSTATLLDSYGSLLKCYTQLVGH